MRWLVGWSSAAAGSARPEGYAAAGGLAILPIGGKLLWEPPDPLWAVGDWRADEIRVVQAEPAPPRSRNARDRTGGGAGSGGFGLAVVGRCGASDRELRDGLLAARGGALRHLTAWPGSYTVVVQAGRRTAVLADLAGVRPVFHTAWAGGTAYATAALPLADLVEAGLDVGHIAALLACPDSPEALGDSTPYLGVRRLPSGHALVLRDGVPDITGYEPATSLVSGGPAVPAEQAVNELREALVDAVRTRLSAPRHGGAADAEGGARHPAGVAGPALVPGIAADLSGGSASGTLALLAAGLPGMPGMLPSSGGERLLAVTFNDVTLNGTASAATAGHRAELARAGAMAADPRLCHVVVPGGVETLPFAGLAQVPLTDEPGPSLVTAARSRRRLAAGGADHLVGHGARQVLDAHPARLADLLLDRRRRKLLRPVTALARANGSAARAAAVPFAVYRAARKLARTSYSQGVEDAAARLLERRFDPAMSPVRLTLRASLEALTWCRPGPAARWLTGEALAEVSIRLRTAAARPDPVERPGVRRARAALNRQGADHRTFVHAAEAYGQRLHAPFLDNQVVRAGQRIPEALRVQPGARPAILRAVLAGTGIRDLPDGWGAPSQAAADFAARAGLRMAADDLVELFATPLLADAGLVEAGVVRAALREAAGGSQLPLDGLAELVAVEVWLRRLTSRRGSCWTGSAAPRQPAVAGGLLRPIRSIRPGATA